MRHLFSIKVFSIIAEEGAISRAARRLSVSTATASAYLDTLEDYLGGKLFIRTTRNLALTDLGRLYLGSINPALDKLEAAEQFASEFAIKPQGTLRVTAGDPLGRLKIAPLIARFLAKYTSVDVQFNIDNSFRSLVDEGYHVAIRAGFDQPSNLIQRKIATNKRVLVASPEYLNGAPPLESPDDLKDHALLLLTQQSDKVGMMRLCVDGTTRKIEVEGKLTSNSNDVLTVWLLKHYGIAQKSLWEVADAITATKLVRLLTDFEPAPVDFFAVSPFRSGQSAKVDAFVTFLHEEFRKNPLC